MSESIPLTDVLTNEEIILMIPIAEDEYDNLEGVEAVGKFVEDSINMESLGLLEQVTENHSDKELQEMSENDLLYEMRKLQRGDIK